MKRFLILSVFFSLVFNCTLNKKPEFIGIEEIKVVNSDLKTITLKAEALFKNPNDVGGTLQTENLKVIINDIEVASVSSEPFDVPAQLNFKIPLIVVVDTEKVIANKSLASLISSLISQELTVSYRGEIAYKILGYSSTYEVDKTQAVKIKF